MKIGNTHIIKFTKEDIKQVYLDSHKWDTWAEIKLKSGSDVRCHSTELDMIMKDKTLRSFTINRKLLFPIK